VATETHLFVIIIIVHEALGLRVSLTALLTETGTVISLWILIALLNYLKSGGIACLLIKIIFLFIFVLMQRTTNNYYTNHIDELYMRDRYYEIHLKKLEHIKA
jgi:hypothetical protein